MKSRALDGKFQKGVEMLTLPVGELSTPELAKRKGIERELRVIRVGPNPRMIVCEYYELASRRVCTVNVKVNRKWRKGMVFVMEEPVLEEEYVSTWIYNGAGPRRPGRW